MIVLTTSKYQKNCDYRLVDVSQKHGTVTILSTNTKFSHRQFFEVNQVAYKLEEDISIGEAIDLLCAEYDPDWHKSDSSLTEEQVEMIERLNKNRRSDIEYLTLINDAPPVIH